MRELLITITVWNWRPAQIKAFVKLNPKLTVLLLYDSKADTKISADLSSHSLGAAFLQKNKQEWRPVTYASRTIC